MEHGQRLHSNLQEAFFRTSQNTNNAILPVPFAKYQKDFESIKEPKPKQVIDIWWLVSFLPEVNIE